MNIARLERVFLRPNITGKKKASTREAVVIHMLTKESLPNI